MLLKNTERFYYLIPKILLKKPFFPVYFSEILGIASVSQPPFINFIPPKHGKKNSKLSLLFFLSLFPNLWTSSLKKSEQKISILRRLEPPPAIKVF